MEIRSFISINLNETLKNEINNLLTDLKKHNFDVKWVPVENLHVTLKFLGHIQMELVAKVKERLYNIVSNFKPFRLRFNGLGFFPDKKRPRVVWIDISDSDVLKYLQEMIEERLAEIGFAREEKGFSPHLTIGRIRSLRDREKLVGIVETIKDREFGIIDVDRVFLMKSDLRPGGAQYSVIAEFLMKSDHNLKEEG
ncbi:MAG: RNA 2',3'-cyclic phosphodiesterase [Thermodesulfovibrionales bacterium]